MHFCDRRPPILFTFKQLHECVVIFLHFFKIRDRSLIFLHILACALEAHNCLLIFFADVALNVPTLMFEPNTSMIIQGT